MSRIEDDAPEPEQPPAPALPLTPVRGLEVFTGEAMGVCGPDGCAVPDAPEETGDR
ncbi:hypothetical protein [Georgenia deserti]|uniref:Uncharacterized protein n=1 Tax=Georgenia deserti TaxID=2093781 RepID=A0ABW4L6L4_9MICO